MFCSKSHQQTHWEEGCKVAEMFYDLRYTVNRILMKIARLERLILVLESDVRDNPNSPENPERVGLCEEIKWDIKKLKIDNAKFLARKRPFGYQ